MDFTDRSHTGMKRQLVQAALTGDPKGLVDYLTTTRDPDISLITLFLPLLHVELIPLLPITSQGRQNAVTAHSAIMVIATQFEVVLSSGTSSSPRESVVRLLTSHHHEILRWFQFFLDHWIGVFPNTAQRSFILVIAYFFHTMVDTESTLTEMVMSDPVAIKAVFRLWTRKVDHGQYINGEGAEYCVIIDLLERVLKHDLGRECLLIMLHTNHRKVAQIFTTVRNRVQELSNFHITISSRSARLGGLLRLTRLLLRQDCQLPRYLMRPLHSPNFISDLCYSLDTIMQRNPRKLPVTVATKHISEIFDLTLGDHGVGLNPVENVKGAVDGGLYSILIRTLSYIPPSKEVPRVLTRILDILAAYAIYPGVLRSLLPAIRGVSWEADLHDRHAGGLKTYLAGFTTWVEERGLLEEDLEKDSHGKRRKEEDMCYCLEHQDSGSIGGVAKSKWCSKCKTVVYCSTRCQRLDWQAGHRRECAEHRTRFDQALSLRTQATLSTFVARFLSSQGRFEELKNHHAPGTLPDVFVTVFDARVLPFDITFLSAVGLKDEASLCDQQESGVVGRYLAQLGGDPSLHLVDAWFPWGRYTINLLVRLRRRGRDEFCALSATVVGILPNEDVFLMERRTVESTV